MLTSTENEQMRLLERKKIRYLISLSGRFYLGRHCRMLTPRDLITLKNTVCDDEDMVNNLRAHNQMLSKKEKLLRVKKGSGESRTEN
jgi:hypothetical protein